MTDFEKRWRWFFWFTEAAFAVAGVIVFLCLSKAARGQDVLLPVYQPNVGTQALAKAGAKASRLWLIVNPNSGPGVKRDAAYAVVIRQANAAKAKVLGYIDLMALPGDGMYPASMKARAKTSAEIVAEKIAYGRLYAGLMFDGWFIDDVNHQTKDSLNTLSSWEGRLVLNPGCAFDLPPSLRRAVVVIAEQAGAWPRALTAWEQSHRSACAVMGLQVSQGSLPVFMSSTAGMALRYASPLNDEWRNGRSVYTSLTPYLEGLLR